MAKGRGGVIWGRGYADGMATKGAWPKKGGGVINGGLKEAELSQGAGTRQWAGLCRLEVSMKEAWPKEGGGVI